MFIICCSVCHFVPNKESAQTHLFCAWHRNRFRLDAFKINSTAHPHTTRKELHIKEQKYDYIENNPLYVFPLLSILHILALVIPFNKSRSLYTLVPVKCKRLVHLRLLLLAIFQWEFFSQGYYAENLFSSSSSIPCCRLRIHNTYCFYPI